MSWNSSNWGGATLPFPHSLPIYPHKSSSGSFSRKERGNGQGVGLSDDDDIPIQAVIDKVRNGGEGLQRCCLLLGLQGNQEALAILL